MDIVVWLRSLGLGKYEAAFRHNEIDETILPNLTAEDLKDLGVGIVGHRRKILDAIAALRAEESAKAPLAGADPKTDTTPEDRAERRQVTVMFSDLVGSTALAARMDPEDLREVISAYQKCVAETVRRFGGFVAKYMGDGVLVYFGYPQAHEDDAAQAVRAGLELIGAVSSLKHDAPLQTRVGIATGLVVVGDLIGSGEAQERGIVGETPNLAARLQALAEPNTVVIADGTPRLLGNLFELEDLGAKELKGISGPIRAFAALRASAVESRFEALHAAGLTALVGREEESELLLRRWSRAKGGEGQVVLLSGEAGIGKSRLTAALLESVASEPHTRLRYFCSPQHIDSAFYPIIGQMERAAGLGYDDILQAKLDKLDAVLAQTVTSKQDAALFAEMLSLANDGRYPALDLAPEQRRQRTMDALIAQTEALIRQSPVLIEQIELQVALITPLIHVKGYAAPETKAAVQRARLLIEQAEAFGEPPEDPLVMFAVLNGYWVANYIAFSGDVARELATQFLALAEKQEAAVPVMIGHRIMGTSLMWTGDIAKGRAHLDRAIALCDPAKHRPLATRFGQDSRVTCLCFRSMTLWLLGYPVAARDDVDQALKEAQEIGQAATLMFALGTATRPYVYCGNYSTAKKLVDELVVLADEKDIFFRKAEGMLVQGCVTRERLGAGFVSGSSVTCRKHNKVGVQLEHRNFACRQKTVILFRRLVGYG